MGNRRWIAVLSMLLTVGMIGYIYYSKSAISIVESDLQTNAINVTGKRSGNATGGTGVLTVREGEHIHLAYDITKGNLSVALSGGPGNENPKIDVDMRFLMENTDSGLLGGDFFEGADYNDIALTGSGSKDFTVQPGDYTVLCLLHDMDGTASFTSVAD